MAISCFDVLEDEQKVPLVYNVDPSVKPDSTMHAQLSTVSGTVAVFLLFNGLLCGLLFLVMHTSLRWEDPELSLDNLMPKAIKEKAKDAEEAHEYVKSKFNSFRNYILVRKVVVMLFLFEAGFISYLFVQDQTKMKVITGAIFTVGAEGWLKFHDVGAIGIHSVAILLGFLLIWNADFASITFLKMGYGLRMRELCESKFRPPDGSCIVFSDIMKYAAQLKNTWRSSNSIIDLVDLTDFYLLLFEDSLIASEPSFLGWTDWTKIRFFWAVAWLFCMFGTLIDRLFLHLFDVLGLTKWKRWSALPEGSRLTWPIPRENSVFLHVIHVNSHMCNREFT
jgi:hypothetical protein